MTNIELNQLETTTGGCAPVPCCPPPCAPPPCAPPCYPPPAPAAAWRWAARAQYRAAASYYGGYGPYAWGGRRWW